MSSEYANYLNRRHDPEVIIEGAGMNDANPLLIPQSLQIRKVELKTSRSGGNLGVFVYFDNVTSGCQFTHFNSLQNPIGEQFVDKMFVDLKAQGETWMDCIEDLNTRKPMFETVLYRDPNNPNYIRPRAFVCTKKNTGKTVTPVKVRPAARAKTPKSDPTEGII